MIFSDVLVSSTLTLPVNIYTWKKKKPCSPGATKIFVPRARKVTICFRGLNFEKKTSLGWEVAPATHTFNWCHVRSIIKVVGKVSGVKPKWPIYVDLTDIFKELPRLQEMDKERQKREESQQKEEKEKRKSG